MHLQFKKPPKKQLFFLTVYVKAIFKEWMKCQLFCRIVLNGIGGKKALIKCYFSINRSCNSKGTIYISKRSKLFTSLWPSTCPMCAFSCFTDVKWNFHTDVWKQQYQKRPRLHQFTRWHYRWHVFQVSPHHPLLWPRVISSLMRAWKKKMLMRFFPPKCPRNKQWFSQKSRCCSQTVFLLCPRWGPPVWESCGCGVKNKIRVAIMNNMVRKILSNNYYEPNRTATGSVLFFEVTFL